MRFLPFRLLNASEREHLAALAERTFGEWGAAWMSGATGAIAAAATAAEVRAELAGDSGWLSCAGAEGAVYLARHEAAAQAICGALAGDARTRMPAAATAAATLVQDALHDLIERFAGPGARFGSEAPPADAWRHASGSACVELVAVEGATLTLIGDADWVRAATAPVRKPTIAMPRLANPQSGIGALPVEIRVWLGNADIDLAALQSLCVNDVVVLDSRIDRPLRITVDGRDTGPRAVLGSSGEHKAVRLTTYAVPH